MATPPTLPHANTVGWYILEGYPWWPVYICDQFKLRPHLNQLGDGHKKILKKAKDFHRDYALVYYFGSYDFSLVKLNKGILKPWDCSEKDQYLKGHPKHLLKKGNTADELKAAINEAEDYLSQPEDMRLPPHMVPSDLDPTLEPPPPMERPEEDEDEDMEEDGDEDADGAEDEEADGDEDMDGEGESKQPKKKAKKAASKKEKPEKEKKPKKEKKEKEKKPPKEKAERKTPTKEKKEKKSAAETKKKSDDTNKDKATKLKRQRSSDGGDENGEGDAAPKPKAKQPKKEKAADVKTDDTENLAEILDREIRWILSNEQYEEMTTKMLRKVLEERLKRDLKQHRDTIKAVVARVIEEEEDAAAATEGDAVKGEPGNTTGDGDVAMAEADETPVKNEPTAPETSDDASKDAPSDVEKSTEEAAPADEPAKEDDEQKPEVEVKHEEKPEEKVADVVPPKPINEADILALKDKLGDANTSHDELLDSLNELQQMPLEMTHLKQTGIARVVANLRQHANDKVSIAAKNLRNAWMQLADKGKQPNNLKRLEKMNEVLESESESDAAKLGVLQKLDKLALTTQEIIDAKIGVTISKLRKSSDAETAAAANKLRQKWKKQAAAS